jgi:hypothetical protein
LKSREGRDGGFISSVGKGAGHGGTNWRLYAQEQFLGQIIRGKEKRFTHTKSDV